MVSNGKVRKIRINIHIPCLKVIVIGDELMDKTIKEIFKDYNSNSFALNAGKIKSINLFKTTKKLELIVMADEFIKIEDIYNFEEYLKQRFNIFDVDVKMVYSKKPEVER